HGVREQRAQSVRQAGEERPRTMREEGIVTGEELVAAVTGERDLDVAASEFREQERGKKAGIGEGLVELRHRLGQEIDAFLAGKRLRGMFGAESAGGQLGPG